MKHHERDSKKPLSVSSTSRVAGMNSMATTALRCDSSIMEICLCTTWVFEVVMFFQRVEKIEQSAVHGTMSQNKTTTWIKEEVILYRMSKEILKHVRKQLESPKPKAVGMVECFSSCEQIKQQHSGRCVENARAVDNKVTNCHDLNSLVWR